MRFHHLETSCFEPECERPRVFENNGNNQSRLLRLSPLILVAIYLGCTLLVNPTGEFPLNDDWSYTRSAFGFAKDNRMLVDEWSAPSLVGQAFYGGLLTKIFGPHFLVLRLSTLILSLGTALLLWLTLKRLNVNPGIVWIAVLAWVFNPLQFCLAFSYMTEVPFLFFIMLAVFLLEVASGNKERWLIGASGAVFGYAFLIRQTALLFVMAAAVAILLHSSKERWGERIKNAGVLSGACAVFMTGYLFWSRLRGGSTPASNRKFELLRHLSSEQILGNSLGLLFYLSFMLLPLWICLVPHLIGAWKQQRAGFKFLWLSIWILIPCFGLGWFRAHYSSPPYLPSRAFHGQMPFLLNILYDTGLGPITLDPTYYGTPPTPVHPQIWLAITVLAAIGVPVVGLIFTIGRGKPRAGCAGNQSLIPCFSALSVTAVTVFEIVFSHLQEGGLFDRHLLIAALPLTLFLAVSSTRSANPGSLRSRAAFQAASVVVFAALAWFCVAATHDYLAWNRLRWQLGNELLQQGVDPLTISGGFEFNGWHNYDTFRARGNIGKIYYWWYDKLTYLIVMEPQEDYRILQRLEYPSWINGRAQHVYLVKKSDAP